MSIFSSQKSNSYELLLSYAFRLLSGKNYTEAEISKKLLRRGKKVQLKGCETAVKKVLKRLHELNYVDDAKILEDYFAYRLKTRPQGKFAFLHEMHARGIPFEKASSEWEKRRIEEEPLALDLVQKKEREFGKLPHVLKKKKFASLLASRGFAPETVWGILENLQ